MTIYKQDHEAGTPGASSISGSGGGGNTPIAAIGTAPIITATSGEVISGTQSAKCVAAAGVASAENMPVALSGGKGGYYAEYTIVAEQIASTVDEPLVTVRGGGAGRAIWNLRASDKKVTFVDNAGTWASPSAITAGTWCFEILVDTGTTTTDGKDKFRVTRKSDGVYGAGMTGWVEQLARNTGAGSALSNLYAGAQATTGAPARSPIIDNLYTVDSYTSAAPGAPVGNVPPTITAPATINTTLSTATLTFQGNDTDGTISSFACFNLSNTATTTVTPTIGPGVVTNPNTASASVTFPISGMTANAKYLFGGTDNDNSGATSTVATATINVTRDTPDIRAVTVVGFTVVGGGSPLDCILAGIAQAAAGQPVTRYLESTAPPGGASVTITFQPATPSSLAKTFAAPVRAKDTTSTETATVTLKMNDSTTIATRGPTTLTTTAAAVGGTTTTGVGSETALITDHSKLSIVVVCN